MNENIKNAQAGKDHHKRIALALQNGSPLHMLETNRGAYIIAHAILALAEATVLAAEINAEAITQSVKKNHTGGPL